MKSPPTRRPLFLAAVLAAAVLAIDLLVELGVATAILYVLVVWLAYTTGDKRNVMGAAFVCSLLTIGGLMFSPNGGEAWKVIANRGLALLVIWVAAATYIHVLQLMAETNLRTREAERWSREMLQQRQEDVRKRRIMASIMEDLQMQGKKLVASELRTRSTIDSALDAVVTIDKDGIITDWNPQAERTFGWSTEEAVGQSLAELIVPAEHRDAHRGGLERFRRTGESRILNRRLELAAVRRSGECFPVELTISPLNLADGYHFSAFVRDISERKMAEQARTLLAAIVESSDDAIIGETLDGIVTSWNAGAQRLYGYTAEEMVGQPIARLVPADRPDEVPQILAKLRHGESVEQIETVRLRKDGTRLDVSLNVSPIRDANGDRIGASSIARDITVRKRLEAELRQANVELAQSNVELQQFASVASHDLQEPLRKISAYCQLLKEEQGQQLDSVGLEYLDIAIDGAERLRTLVRDLLAFSRVTTRGNPLGPSDANACLQTAISNLEVVIAENEAQITADPLPVVIADDSQLVHLFQNLLANAIKYRAEPTPKIHIGGCRRGDTYQFSVSDNGIGIAAEFYGKIFGIFQRLHNRREYSGTGIGLALCKRILERFGGQIWVESTQGVGSTFYFTIPIVDQGGDANVDSRELEFRGASR